MSPPVEDESLREIPAKRGVILLAGENDEPIVLLTAADMRSRVRTRLSEPPDDDRQSKAPDLRGITRSILFRRCESHFETDWRCLEATARIWPKRLGDLLGWKPPWFVFCDPEEDYPWFRRTRDPGQKGEHRFGPFPSGTDADTFIDALIDAFDLCRSIQCLRQAPDGPRCAYAEMGRCLSPVDGSISMDDYRHHVRAAIEFAVGNRRPLRERLQQRMNETAAELAFEKAESCKQRLVRLELFNAPAYRYVAPANRFQFLFIQGGAGIHEVRRFAVHGGEIRDLGPAEYPLRREQTEELLGEAEKVFTQPLRTDGLLRRLRMGLSSRTLFTEGTRGGLAIPCSPRPSVDTVIQSIEAHAELLGVQGKR